jgi:hypothetical protein
MRPANGTHADAGAARQLKLNGTLPLVLPVLQLCQPCSCWTCPSTSSVTWFPSRGTTSACGVEQHRYAATQSAQSRRVLGPFNLLAKQENGSGHSTWLLTVHLRYLCAVKGTVRPSALILGAEREGECLSSPQHHTRSSCQQG